MFFEKPAMSACAKGVGRKSGADIFRYGASQMRPSGRTRRSPLAVTIAVGSLNVTKWADFLKSGIAQMLNSQ